MSELSLDENSVEFLENNADSKRALAYVAVISDLIPIDGADSIELAKVNGYNAVVTKGSYNVGDEVIYVESGVMLPENRPEYAFMEKNKFKLKTIKLRGVYSQGLITPMDSLTDEEQFKLMNYPEGGLPLGPGFDLTEVLGIKTIPEKPLSGGSANMGRPKGNFPPFLRKTDETRLAGMKPAKYLAKNRGRVLTGKVKLDGSSATFYMNRDEFGVCSRNLDLKEEGGGAFWACAKKYEIEKAMRNYGCNIGVQAELVGPGIQGNKYNLKEIDFYVHNVWDIDTMQNLYPQDMSGVCKILGFKECPDAFEPFVLEDQTYEDLYLLAEKPAVLNPDIPEEGFVGRFRDQLLLNFSDPGFDEDEMDGMQFGTSKYSRLSFKIINKVFAHKYGH